MVAAAVAVFVVYSLVLKRMLAAAQFLCNGMDLCILRPSSNEMHSRSCLTLLIHFDFVNRANATNGNRSHVVVLYAMQHRFHRWSDALCNKLIRTQSND